MRILLIEDDPLIGDGMKIGLEKLGFSVDWFTDGAEGEEALLQTPYAAVILAGGILGRALYHTSYKYTLMPLDGAWNKGVCFLGRHSAFIFVAHMVVIPVLLALFALLVSCF